MKSRRISVGAVPNGRRVYQCRTCGKTDRRCRLVGHVLKYHVPFDRVPYSCSLCNFRTTEPILLTNHLTQYRRHVEEASRAVKVDLSVVLCKSTNPVVIDETFITRVDPVLDDVLALPEDPLDQEGAFDAQDDEAALPEWLAKDSLQIRGTQQAVGHPTAPVTPSSGLQPSATSQFRPQPVHGINQIPQLGAVSDWCPQMPTNLGLLPGHVKSLESAPALGPFSTTAIPVGSVQQSSLNQFRAPPITSPTLPDWLKFVPPTTVTSYTVALSSPPTTSITQHSTEVPSMPVPTSTSSSVPVETPPSKKARITEPATPLVDEAPEGVSFLQELLKPTEPTDPLLIETSSAEKPKSGAELIASAISGSSSSIVAALEANARAIRAQGRIFERMVEELGRMERRLSFIERAMGPNDASRPNTSGRSTEPAIRAPEKERARKDTVTPMKESRAPAIKSVVTKASK